MIEDLPFCPSVRLWLHQTQPHGWCVVRSLRIRVEGGNCFSWQVALLLSAVGPEPPRPSPLAPLQAWEEIVPTRL